MRGVVCTEAGAPVVVEELEVPGLGPHDVLVRTDASGVCHTDLSLAQGASARTFPILLGHEGAGTVLEVGREVTRCRVGDRVVMSWSPQCGTCRWCARGMAQHCERSGLRSTRRSMLRADGDALALGGGIGTFAELMHVSELSVVPVDTDLPAEELAMIGCGVTTGVGAALWTAPVEPGSTVAVLGCGGVGLSVVQGARIAGAIRILAVDPVAEKREIALRFGATDAVDPADGDVAEQLRAATGGDGVDTAFEVVGSPAVLRQAFDAVRRRGTAVAVGMAAPGSAVELPMTELFAEEKRVVGSFYGSAQVNHHIPLIVRLAERGLLDLSSMVSRRLGLDDVNEAFAAIRSGTVVRNVIVPR
jgi:S-(hydroxymethyl)glutathione dehydrogenase/alcohol dehydrogenase